jgi:putative membrane protein
MARFRTQLALDRTTLAWVRTTLSMASFGFGMVAFFRTIQEKSPSAEAIRLYQGAIRVGTALLSVGIGGAVLAGVSHWLALRQLASGQPVDANRWSLSVALVILTAIIGLMALWELYAR